MKQLISMALCVLLMAGCSGSHKDLDRAAKLRSDLLNAEECAFHGEITADDGSDVFSFEVDCTADREGTVRFLINAPQTIAGIGGSLSHHGGELSFQDTVLQIGMLADDRVTPVAAPWIFIKTLRSGSVTAACREGDLLRLTIRDGYEEGALQGDLWIDSADRPVMGEFLYEGKRILSLKITDFQIR